MTELLVTYFCWLNLNAGGIQALCAIFGFLGLCFYCYLTYCIRQAAVAQQKAAQAPMLMFFERDKVWALKNYGVGPATQVFWKPDAQNAKSTEWYELGALGPGDESDLPHSSRPKEPRLFEMYDSGARIHYSDMAGNHYATWGLWRDNAFLQNWAEVKGKARLDLKM
jgi:hypothetical protein